MVYKIKGQTKKEDVYKIEKDKKFFSKVPYQDEVETFANPKTKEIIWIKREDVGKGWTNVYINGKLVEKSRNPSSFYQLVPQEFKEVSLFSEMNYHSSLNRKEAGKITNYGTHDYTLQYSDYKPMGRYKFQSPLRTGKKDEFGRIKKDIEFQEWNYAVLDWNPDGKLFIKHTISNPYGEKKEIFQSKKYDLSEEKQAISDFRKYVRKIKEKK